MHKRLCYLITRTEQGGAQSHVRELLQGLRGEYRLSLVSGENHALMARARELGIETHLCNDLVQPLALRRDRRAYRELTAYLNRTVPDLVHLHSSKAGIIGRFAARQIGVQSIFTAHGWAFAEGTPFTRRLIAVPSEWLAARVCAKIITVSRADFQLARKYRIAPTEKLVHIPNGISDTVHRADPESAEPLIIAMTARFAPPKDPRCLFAAAAKLTRPWRLIMIGGGPELAAARAYASELGITERVEFLGERTDVDRLLATAHVFVLASRWEGLPISVLEAMRAGLPVVASDVGGVRELVGPDCGFLVPGADSEALAARLDQLMSDVDLRRRMGAAARQRYVSEFTAKRMLAQVRRVYEEVLNPDG